MESTILAINTGSSSHEYAIYQNDREVIHGHYEKIKSSFKLTLKIISRSHNVEINENDYNDSLNHFLRKASATIRNEQITAIGIRIVAPGRFFIDSQVLNEQYFNKLQASLQLAPLHIKPILKDIESAQKHLPNTSMYAISDSEFHKTLSHEARNYAIPRDDAEATDIYRYGYHGISISSIVTQMSEKLNPAEKVIVCHLGSGISISALLNNRSIDNSMGYSTMEGTIMATRSGDIGVEAAIHLGAMLNLDNNQLIEYLHTKSGLLGLSGESADVRKLLEQESDGDENARFALSYMIYSIKQQIGAFIATLGGIDRLVMTATIGERSSTIRDRICQNTDYLNIYLDEQLNETVNSTFSLISKPDSVPVYVIPTDETREIYKRTNELVK